MSSVIVKIKFHSPYAHGARVTHPGIMDGFPFFEDQYVEEGDNGTLELHLGDRNDLTAAQEQHLNTHPDVVSYETIN